MKNLILIFLLVFFAPAAKANESCAAESLGLTKASSLSEVLFYTGTCHYRNKDYDNAVISWTKLAKLRNVDPKHVDLQIDVLNNLGYMMFFGYGIDADQNKAVSYWKKAVSLGHTESEYHLCHAYADKEYSTYSPVKAKPHCRKALLLYAAIKERRPGEETILSQLKRYSRLIEN